MTIIEINKSEIGTGWIFEVTVSNGNSTTHKVNLTREYYDHLSLSDTTPTKLVEGSFRFLLGSLSNKNLKEPSTSFVGVVSDNDKWS